MDIDFEAMGRDILAVLVQHGLQPDSFDVGVVLASTAFDRLLGRHPAVIHERMLGINIQVNGVPASIQILRRRDVHPDMIMRPPE